MPTLLPNRQALTHPTGLFQVGASCKPAKTCWTTARWPLVSRNFHKRCHAVSPFPCNITEDRNLLASICCTCGSARRTLFRYTAGPRVCKGLPSKYTVSSSALSLNSLSTSWKLEIWLLDARTPRDASSVIYFRDARSGCWKCREHGV